MSGADDATIDIRKSQKPPGELPPSLEPVNEPPSDSVASPEPVAPAEGVIAPPGPLVPPQGGAEIDDGASPPPDSPAVPNYDVDRPGNALPQTTEEYRPSDSLRPERPGWMEMPEANASVFGAEKAPLSAGKVPGQTQPRVDVRTSETDGGAMDEAGDSKNQPNESKGPFLSLGEGQNEFAGSSRKSRGQANGEAINPVAGALPTESESDRSTQNQEAVLPVVAKAPLGSAPDNSVAGQISPGGVNQGTSAHQSETDSWGAFGNGTRPVHPQPAEHVRSKLTKADNGSRVQGPSGQIRRIAPVKNRKAIGGVDGEQPFSVRQKRKSSVDDQVRKSSKNGSVSAGDRRKRRQNQTPVGHQAALVPRVGESGVYLLGFEVSKNLVEYLNVIEQFTTTSLHPKQLEGLLPIATTTKFLRLSPEALELHRAEFTQSVKDKLIAEWEMMTGQKWPVYEKDIPNSKGGIYRRKGTPYDAHHIIPKSYGGPHRWENLTPARSPNEHQEGIHSHPITKYLFP